MLDLLIAARKQGHVEGAAKIDHPYYLTHDTALAFFGSAGYEPVAERLSRDGHWGFVLRPASRASRTGTSSRARAAAMIEELRSHEDARARPARGGSTRVPRKNLAVLGGRTLVRRALETALAAGCFETVALSSDEDEILAEADGLDAVALRRPPEVSSETARARDFVWHALGELGDFDALAIVQCTSPFTAPEDVAGAVALLERTGADSVVTVSVADAAHHPLKMKRLEGDRLLPYLEDDRLTPSHELEQLWVRNGSVYVFRREAAERGLEADDVRGYEDAAGALVRHRHAPRI
jgi:CMP-N-acetylneuraminic acid synthetase